MDNFRFGLDGGVQSLESGPSVDPHAEADVHLAPLPALPPDQIEHAEYEPSDDDLAEYRTWCDRIAELERLRAMDDALDRLAGG